MINGNYVEFFHQFMICRNSLNRQSQYPDHYEEGYQETL